MKDLHTGWTWDPNEILPQSWRCLENHCKDRKWCFPFGVWHVSAPWAHMAHRLLCFSHGFLPFDAPIGLFCSVSWCLLCSLLISYSTALIGSAGLPHFPRCPQVGLMLKTNKLKIISDLSSFGQRGWPEVNHWAVFAKGFLPKIFKYMSQRWNFLPKNTLQSKQRVASLRLM